MSKVKIIIISCVALLVFGAAIFSIKYFKPQSGGLVINTNPRSSVYINGELVGKTPYTEINSVGQINLKLVPDSPNKKLLAYETKINLISGIKTIVDREFNVTEDSSSGDVIYFDKNNTSFAGIVVISNPENSEVWIDGVKQGATPYNFDSITTGSHKILIKKVGYTERSINVKTVQGLRLNIFVKLAKSSGEEVNPSPSPLPQTEKAYVIIKDTPTGFLRMRTLPGTNGEEIAELKPGEKYLYLDKDASNSGWFKIQYKDPAPGLPNGITGWVSNQYSLIASESATLK